MKKHSKQALFNNPDEALEAALNAIDRSDLADLEKAFKSTYTHTYTVDFAPSPDDGEAVMMIETHEQQVRCIHKDNIWVLLLAAIPSKKLFRKLITFCEADSSLAKAIQDFMPRYKDRYSADYNKDDLETLIRVSAVQIQSYAAAEKHALRMGYNNPEIAKRLIYVDGISDELHEFLEGIADLKMSAELPNPGKLTRQFLSDLVNYLEDLSDSIADLDNNNKFNKQLFTLSQALAEAKEIEKSKLPAYDKLSHIIDIIVKTHNLIMDEAVKKNLLKSKNKSLIPDLHDFLLADSTHHDLELLGIDVGYDPKTHHMKSHHNKPDRYRGATLSNNDFDDY